MTQTDSIMTLSNGRQLGYAEYGDPNGFPIFFFHVEQHKVVKWLVYRALRRLCPTKSPQWILKG